MKKLISSGEDKVSYIQIFGFILIVTGVLAIIIAGLFKNDASVIAISFFITMLGVAFAFPKLLEGNDGLSTMRIVVFMVTNVICILLIKIGWNKESLECIGLNQWWMGVIAFVFGAKATQSYFESKLAVPPEIPKTGMAAVQFSNADIAKLAVVQNEQYLKTKFSNIVSVSDAVHDLNSTESHVIALYLKDYNTVGIPDRLEVKMADGSVKTIATEIIKGVGIGKIHVNQLDQISNENSLGSVCCQIVTEDNQKKVVTAGHVFSKGDSTNFHGELTKAEQSKALINDSEIGNWYFQIIDYKTDVALASIENWQNDSKYISFKDKEHHQVNDSDIGKTKVRVVSNIFDPKQRDAFILDYNTQWEVQYDDKTTTKNNVIVIGNSPDRNNSETVSRKGDSGGCVFEPVSGNLVGLILGGNAMFTWVLPLNEVFEYYNYKLS